MANIYNATLEGVVCDNSFIYLGHCFFLTDDEDKVETCDETLRHVCLSHIKELPSFKPDDAPFDEHIHQCVLKANQELDTMMSILASQPNEYNDVYEKCIEAKDLLCDIEYDIECIKNGKRNTHD